MAYKKIAPFIICTLGASFYVYDYFLAVAPSIMTNTLMNTFNLSAGALSTILAIFFLASTFFQIPAGVLLDRFGARLLLSLAVLISGMGTLLFGLAHTAWMLGLARLLMGIGSPFAFLGALFLASRWFAHKHFALIAGLVQFGCALGSIIGGGPLAYFVNGFGWRATMTGIGGSTLLLSLLFWLILKDGEANKVNYAFSDQTLLDVFKQKSVWWIALISFASWATVTGIGALWGIPYLMCLYHISNESAGYTYILFWLGLGLGSAWLGWWSDRLQKRKLPFYLCFSIGIIASLLFILAPHLSLAVSIFLLFLLGFTGSTQSLSFGIAKDLIPPKHFVAASGLINLAAVVTGVVVQPFIGYLIDWHAKMYPSLATPLYNVSDYQMGFVVIPIVLLLGLLTTWLGLPETHCQATYEL